MASKTSKPTGLSIKRDKAKFVTSWKRSGSDYGDGQQWQYKINNGSWKHHPNSSDSDISKTADSKTLSVDFDDYYPFVGSTPKLTKFSFRVRGNKSKSGKTNLGWSDWAEKSYTVNPPSKPSVTVETTENMTRFSWTVSTSDTNSKPFYRVLVYTALKQGFSGSTSENTDWTKIKDQTTHEGATIRKNGYVSAKEGFKETGYIEFTENSSKIGDTTNGNWRRMVRVRAQGCGGYADYVFKDHVYGKAEMATQGDGNVKETSGGYNITVNWDTAYDKSSPIDETKVQWAITAPNSDMSCPTTGVTWNDGATRYDTGGSESAVLTIDETVGYDECLYTRVTTYHDNTPTHGDAKLQITGKLSPPTITVGSTSQPNATAQITISHGFVVSGTKVAIIYNKDGAETIVGLVSSSTTVTVKCPSWSEGDTVTFGAKAVLPKSISSSTDDGVTIYDIDAYMESDLIMQSGTVAQAPSNVTLSKSEDDVRVSWQNNWTDAEGIELSWAESPYAWESTDQPETFSIDNPFLNSWRIAGLETGKAWYVRVRAFVENDSNVKSYSPFSPTASINLSSAPSIPTLALSRGVVPIGESVTASWNFASTDGTPQEEARIYSENVLIATTKTQEYADLKFDTAGTYRLCVEVISASGQSSGKSPTVNLVVAEPLTCSMTTSFTDVTVTDDDGEDRTVHALTALPLTATVTGIGNGGTTSLTITRTASFHLERPDGSELDGFSGETILSYTQDDDEAITIGYADLIGSLDDGGEYRLTATVTDSIGQTASVSEDFTVLWARQAIVPDGEVIIDRDNYAAILKPIAPTGTIQSDVCDIYRLSADKPALVYRGAVFGEKYVDPYPTIGENGGYRFVFRTVDGDYTTADGGLAFYDCYDDVLELTDTIINFGGETLVLQYNLDVSHSWEKGFVSERFLDGSVKGFWNAGVGRSGDISSVSIPMLEEDVISALRRLSEYEGRCHLRTPDGSSFPADIQVSESWNHDKRWTMADFQFNITRTDSEPEGIRYADWVSV